MVMLLLSLFYACVVQVYGCWLYGIKVFIYLTSWCSILHTFTIWHLWFYQRASKFRDFLMVTSWSLGWTVTFIFWFLIFPIIEPAQLPPVPQYISTHGGINLLISYFFIKSDIKVSKNQISYPLTVLFVYLFGMISPLKFFGINVYPKFLDEVKATLIYLIGSILLIVISFYIGYFLKRQKDKTS